MSRNLTYLRQILDAVNKIEHYTFEGRDAFFDTTLIQDAVLRNMEIIGEVAKRVSVDFKDEHP